MTAHAARPALAGLSAVLFALLFASIGLTAGASRAAQTVWNFNPGPAPLAASAGPGTLSYRGDTASVATINTASRLGLPILPGGDSGVLSLPALSAARGLALNTAAPPNGVHTPSGWTSNYTLAFDLFIPAASFNAPRALLQTNPANTNDADYRVNDQGRLGYDTLYNGSLRPNTWHRVVFVVGAADGEGLAQTFIDGVFVGGHGGTGSGVSSRWALYSQPGTDALLFADDNTQTAPLAVSSIMFLDRRMLPDEVRALGGPHAAGLGTPGPAPTPTPRTLRCAGAVAHRGDSGAAPENTLAAIDRAIALGAAAVEIDIRLSSDGVAVLMHDSTMDRTTDLSGPAAGFTAAQMQQADAGSWFDARYADQRVPTLAQAFERLRGTGVIPYLDVKVAGMGPAIRAALQQTGMTERDIWLWAYNRSLVAEFNAALPHPRIFVGEIPRTQAQFAELRALNVVGLDLGFTAYTTGQVDAAWVAQARAEGFLTCGYTVVRPDDMATMITMGVDFIETDYPAMVLDAGLPPAFAGDPLPASVLRGQTATFTAQASGATRRSWTRDGSTLTDGPTPWGSLITGSATPTLTIINAQPQDAGLYAALAANPCAASTSGPASLTLCAADWNADGVADFNDLLAFLNDLNTPAPAADLNRDGVIDFNDLLAFLNAFNAGC